jgi:type I restriction enzyme S subunit
MVKEGYKYINFINFSSLKEWDFKRYNIYSTSSEYPIEKLGKHIVHQTKKHNLFDYPSKTFGILGISNEIGMFDAYEEKGEKIRQAYKIVENGFISYNPYRINVGSIGIKTDAEKNRFIIPAYVVISCKETLLPEFLFIMMKSDYFNKLIKSRTTGSVRQTLSYKNLSEIEIPIPDIETQKKILQNFNNVIDKSKLLENKVKELEDSLDSALFEELGIKEIEESNKTTSKLQFTNFKRLIKWGVEFNLAPAVKWPPLSRHNF